MVQEIGPGRYTAFAGERRLTSGELHELGLAMKRALESGAAEPLLVFDDATGRPVDLDLRGSEAELAARLATTAAAPEAQDRSEDPEPRGRGRPRLGVVAREVTLLPRHWDWLNRQPGGASVTLRRLVEAARKASGDADRQRHAREAAYAFIQAMAGDAPGFEEVARALFAGDLKGFAAKMATWPPDVRDYAVALAFRSAE
jgi:hypothetical protein